MQLCVCVCIRRSGCYHLLTGIAVIFVCLSLCAVGALYDITICYRGTRNPSIVDVINAEPCSADLYMRRFAMADVVKDNPDDASLTKWLIGIFKEKVFFVLCMHPILGQEQLELPRATGTPSCTPPPNRYTCH